MNRERAEAFLRLVAEAELRQLTTDPRDSAPLPDVPGAEREAAGLLRRPAVVAMLRALDDRQREAITLQYHAGLSEAETAATMRISRSAVRVSCPAFSGQGIRGYFTLLPARSGTRPGLPVASGTRAWSGDEFYYSGARSTAQYHP